MKTKFEWDAHSDQPYPLKDKAYKKSMKQKNKADLIPLVLYNLILFPATFLASYWLKSKREHDRDFFALCVNLDKTDVQVELVEELGCSHIQIRVPLADIDNLQAYVEFANKFKTCKILVNILQDRAHIDDHVLLKESLQSIFLAFSGISCVYQVGNAINRTKWGFFSVAEYIAFYQCAQQLRDSQFPLYELVGPSVIDYEYHFTIRALFNGAKIRFDRLSSLLYVDRRGAPENTQMGVFDTIKKIDFLYAIAKLSPKSSTDILITEANWPISDTAPWAPTSETECVSEETYANYLLRYYLLAMASGKIEAVFWHQLIAPGYGLIDTREGLRKRTAFYVFKTMLHYLQNAQVTSFSTHNGVYRLCCTTELHRIEILWLNSADTKPYITTHKVLNKEGEVINGSVSLSASPIYIIS